MSGSRPEPAETEEQIDDALADTFPASDPPATGGSTGPSDKQEGA